MTHRGVQIGLEERHMSRNALGDLEHLVLLALVRLGDESYGVPILDEIADRTEAVPISRAATCTPSRCGVWRPRACCGRGSK